MAYPSPLSFFTDSRMLARLPRTSATAAMDHCDFVMRLLMIGPQIVADAGRRPVWSTRRILLTVPVVSPHISPESRRSSLYNAVQGDGITAFTGSRSITKMFVSSFVGAVVSLRMRSRNAGDPMERARGRNVSKSIVGCTLRDREIPSSLPGDIPIGCDGGLILRG